MPRAPRLCNGCTAVATKGAWCDVHRPAPFAGAQERWAAARPSNWSKIRRAVLRRDGGVCRSCGRPATAVDHIRPVSEGGSWDLDNLVAICDEDHKIKIQEEAQRARRRLR